MNRRTLAISLLLFLATLGVYGRAAWFGFIAYDDPKYVSENEQVLAGLSARGIAWAFTTDRASNWHPLTWLSHMLDVTLFGPSPGPMHLVNVLLHALAAVVLFLALLRMTGAAWASAFVAALFALHPTRAESVAWIAERKDVLSGLFWMLTLWAYAAFVQRGGAWRYALVLLAFALGLMAKPMLVTLPCELLLLDVWPLRRLGPGALEAARRTPGRLMLEKAPLLALALIACIMTLRAQQGAMADASALPPGARFDNAVVAYARYLGLLLYPHDLAVLYPHRAGGWSGAAVVGSITLLLVITALAASQYRGRGRRRVYLLVGWLWFLGALVPVIGIVQVGVQSMADRYTYLPFIGLFIAVAWGARDLATWRPRMAWPIATAACLAVVLSAVASWRQTGFWSDSRTLFMRTIQVTDDNWMIHNNLGVALGQEGAHREAGLHFLRSMEIRPDDAMAQGNLLLTVERMREGGASVDADLLSAIARMLQRRRAEPSAADWPFNLGVLYRRLDEFDRAIMHFQDALRLQPGDAEACLRLGAAHQDAGEIEAAMASYRRALSLNSDDPAVLKTLAWLLATHPRDDLRDGAEAQRLAERARAATEGRDAEALIVLAAAHAEQGRFDEARALLAPLLGAESDAVRPEWLERARALAAAIDEQRPLRSGASIWR